MVKIIQNPTAISKQKDPYLKDFKNLMIHCGPISIRVDCGAINDAYASNSAFQRRALERAEL